MTISLILRVSGLAVAIAACAAAGCSDSSGPARRVPAGLDVVVGTPQEGESGEPLPIPLTVKATDRNGRLVANAVVSFTISAGGGALSAAADTTDASGIASVIWTLGSQLGAASVEARVTNVATPAIFIATVKVGPPSALQLVSSAVGNSAAGFEVIDSVAVRVVDRFDHPIAGAEVAFAITAGGGATSHASKLSGSDGIARTAWTLGAAGAQTLRATLGTIEATVSGTAVNCPEAQLAIGEVLTLLSGSPTCVLLTGNAQKFVVATVNTTSSASFSSGFRLRGAGSAAAALATSLPAPSLLARSPAFAAVAQERTAADAHATLLQSNAELLDRLGPNRRAQLRSQLRPLVQAAALPALGDVLPVNIPVDFSNICSLSNSARIGGRVAYVGTHSVILEDTLAPLRGENDAVYSMVGQEFDSVMWPILTTNYGNPLAMDAQLDANGRIFMVFSPRINTVQGGTVAGFVTGGDFFTTQDCAASNVGEYFYARVPTRAGGGFDSDNTTVTVDEWLRSTRAVIMHEVKHVTSYAEKFASPDILPSGFFTNDAWLEESTAMVAEELWARTVFGYGFRGNVDYAASVFCEVRPTVGSCAGKPTAMFDHFYWLSQFARATETKSPVGSPSDASVYGSGWLFIRWLLDQYATTEAAILGPMTTEALRPGVASVEAHTGKSFTELISDWALAFVLDDYPGITLSDQKHGILSWNLRDIYSNLNADFSGQGFFLTPFPLSVRAAGFGKFLIDVASVRGGSMSVAEVSGMQSAQQLFEFKGISGNEFPAHMRVNIVRVQ